MRETEFHVRREEGGTLLLHGVIDENADLSFFGELRTTTRLNMRHVRRINSYGVRSWIEAIRTVQGGVSIELLECPPSVVDQINMVAGFIGRGRVVSFFAPMACDACGHEIDHLFYVSDYRTRQRLPDVSCPRCGRAMHVDDLEEQYLMFAREEMGP
jgi:eukaryotic-like serine/threonine-protein kinase